MPVTRRDLARIGAALPALARLGAAAPQQSFEKHLRNDQDVELPDWGPYTLRYIGISHVADRGRGLRFDLSVFPGLYRRKVVVPNARWESDYTPWEASADLYYYCFRHQLEWKDRVYADISYSRIGEHVRLIRAECVNRTSRPQNLVLHQMAYLNFPGPGQEVMLPAGAKWIHALDYSDLKFATSRPTDNLVYDGWLRGEARDAGYTGGYGIGKGFGAERGDRLDYQFTLENAIEDAVLLVRARVAKGDSAEVTVEPLASGTQRIGGTGEFTVTRITAGRVPAGQHKFALVSTSGTGVELDGIAIAPAGSAAEVRFRPVRQDPVPDEIVEGPRPGSVLVRYKGLGRFYGMAWNSGSVQIRQFFCEELDRWFRDRVQDHVSLVLRGPGEGHFTNLFLRPIPIGPQSSRVVYGVVCDGTREEATRALAGFPAEDAACEAIYTVARGARVSVAGGAEGRRYEFSQNLMAAANLTNVTFPLYVRRHYVTHTTPGRWWPMLYSWDAGFTGLGLLELDLERAVGCLNTYLTSTGDQHAAFIHHGTPLPVQIFLFLEIWNRTQSRELLEFFYPRVRQYHRFLAGRLGSSSTHRLQSQLLQTWDYFYNTGWDDYPPQQYMHAKKLQKTTAAAVTTAHAIRTAKILGMAARALGRSADLAEYEQDIGIWTEALQRNSWDEASGYFGYVTHDGAGRPAGILRHESGANFNMGMCGAYPMFAGICTGAQEKRIVGHLMSERHLWTRIGMTTVDQSAPYYRPDGYWNGAVWMPHQWFFWKALLDLGYSQEAHHIARTALDLWQQEVDDSYGCFEHFMVESGRGAGWQHFTGISNPVLCWFGAYHRQGQFTTGFDAWVERREFTNNNRRLEVDMQLRGAAGRKAVVLAGMQPGPRYRATWAGREVTPKVLSSGALELALENTAVTRKLTIAPV